MNTYGYAYQNPLIYSDLYGLQAITWGQGVRVLGGIGSMVLPVPGARALGAVLITSAIVTGDTPKECKDDDDECEKERQFLEQGKQALLNWKFTGLSLPERVAQAAEYNEQVRELNILIALHNEKCPEHRVEPLSTIPISGKPDY